MGPVEITASANLLQILRIYMDARLPTFVLPEPPRIDVRLDPNQANHLRILMSTADIRALKNAWVEKGYNNMGSRIAYGGEWTLPPSWVEKLWSS
ncbi:hypothetical protein B0H13DRAFT_2303558 [Mycena leptocephala]|nr:hypothetical protein B0H13DRAFT_2303558 [Mycena leptocephala]